MPKLYLTRPKAVKLFYYKPDLREDPYAGKRQP